MALLSFIFLLILLFTIIFMISDKIKYSTKLYSLLAIDFLLILSILFRHYLYNILLFFSYSVILLLLIVNLLFTIILLIKYSKKIYCVNLIIPIISIFLFFSNIHEEIMIRIELPRAKSRLENILNNESYLSRYDVVRMGDGIYAFIIWRGIIDPWRAIAYDSSGMLEKVVENFRDSRRFSGLENYYELKNFRGRLRTIEKLEENWFLCLFFH